MVIIMAKRVVAVKSYIFHAKATDATILVQRFSRERGTVGGRDMV